MLFIFKTDAELTFVPWVGAVEISMSISFYHPTVSLFSTSDMSFDAERLNAFAIWKFVISEGCL